MPSDKDDHGIPQRGSALHIAYYVNCEPEALNPAVLGSANDASIAWRSPLAARRFEEYKDYDFLAAGERTALGGDLRAWWPKTGPRWDALGVVVATGAVVL